MRYGTWYMRACAAAAVLAAALIGLRLAGVGRPTAPPKQTELMLPGDPELVARTEAKRRIAADVTAGRTSLLEAAAAFRDLDAHGPPGLVRMGFPQAASEDEAYCRSVIAYVAFGPPAGRDDRVRALEAELDSRLRDGTLRMTPPDDHAWDWDYGRRGNCDDTLNKYEHQPPQDPAAGRR